MINSFVYTKTIIDGEKFLRNTGNIFEFVAQRPYNDKKGVLPDGVVVTLHILKDSGDYGVDKRNGTPRQNNKGQNFDATILCGTQYINIQQGEYVSLVDFDEEHSFAIGFDLLMRFKGIKKANTTTQGGSTGAKPIGR